MQARTRPPEATPKGGTRSPRQNSPGSRAPRNLLSSIHQIYLPVAAMFRYSGQGLQCLLSAIIVWDDESALRDVGITKGFSRTRGVGTQTTP